jgi:hypothetical protein
MQSTAAESITKPLRSSYTRWSPAWKSIILMHQGQRECHSHTQPTGTSPWPETCQLSSPIHLRPFWGQIPLTTCHTSFPPPILPAPAPTNPQLHGAHCHIPTCFFPCNRQPIIGPPSFQCLTLVIQHLMTLSTWRNCKFSSTQWPKMFLVLSQ